MVSWSVHSRVQTRHDCVPFVCVQGARMVRELFEMARSKKACIIFFDEIDAVGGNLFIQDYVIITSGKLRLLLNTYLITEDSSTHCIVFN